MKKTFKLSIAIAFVLILIAPIVISGCIFGNKASLDLKTSFKTEYYVGEQLDVTGGSLLYTDANGTEKEVALLSTMVSGFESDEVGTFELTITYKDATLKLNYVIISQPTEPTLQLTSNFKVNYLVGETLDVTGGKLLYTNSSGIETEVTLLSTMVSGFESDEVGTYNLTIVYEGISITVPYTVSRPADPEVVAKLEELSGMYYEKEGTDTTKGYVLIITPQLFVYGYYNEEIVGKSYDEIYQEIINEPSTGNATGYMAKASASEIEISTENNNYIVFGASLYGHQQEYSFSFCSVWEGTAIALEIIDENDNPINFDRYTQIFDLEGNEIEVITLHCTRSASYILGETYDVTRLTIFWVNSYGVETQFEALPSMVSGFQTEEIGNFWLTVEYKGASVDIPYTVVSPLSEMEGYYITDEDGTMVAIIKDDLFVIGNYYGEISSTNSENIDAALEEESLSCHPNGYVARAEISDITFTSSTEFNFMAPVHYNSDATTINATFTIAYLDNKINLTMTHSYGTITFLLEKAFE